MNATPPLDSVASRSKDRVHRTAPTPRPEVFRLYWYFAAERQRVFDARMNGSPGPWTSDPILQRYKFCNVYRVTDRVSQYLMREIVKPAFGEPADQLFQICMFRFFSNTETWDHLCQTLGRPPLIQDLSGGALISALQSAKRSLRSIYTSAFILCASDPFGLGKKHLTHHRLFERMFVVDALGEELLECKTYSALFLALRRYPLIGDFMAYQIATDLNYTEFFRFSENEFTKAGPGAKRGIHKVFESTGGYSLDDLVLWMVERQCEQFDRYELPFRGLFGRPLHAIDCQGLFCEVDKYCRQALPDLVSNRTRIKTRFSPRSTFQQLNAETVVLPRHWHTS